MYKIVLQNLYKSKGVASLFPTEYTYLKPAIQNIDALWDKNFALMKEVKLIIFGEAPLWGGNNPSYIYNPDYNGPSDFLTCSNLLKCYKNEVCSNKMEQLSLMQRKGILVIDVLPFPFNTTITSICYSNRSKLPCKKLITPLEYSSLIRQTFKDHLEPKLKKAFQKVKEPQELKVAYRYKKVSKHHVEIRKLAMAAGIINFPALFTDLSGRPYGGLDHAALCGVVPK